MNNEIQHHESQNEWSIDFLNKLTWMQVFYIHITMSFIMGLLFLLSIMRRSLDMVPWLVIFDYARVSIKQALLFSLEFDFGSYDIVTHLFMNFLRISMAFTLSKFILNKTFKRVITVIHFIFVVVSFNSASTILSGQSFLEKIRNHNYDDFYLLMVFICIFVLDRYTFGAEEDEQLRDLINTELLRKEHEMILSSINSGIITVRGDKNKGVNYSNEFA